MNATDKIDKLIKNLKTTASPELDRRIDTLLERSKQSQTRSLNTWRKIMKNPITKFTAAAIIILAVLIGVYQITGSIDGSGVAWADVIRPVLKAVSVEYDAVIDETGDDPQRFHDVVVGPRIHRSYAEGPVQKAIIDTETKTLFLLVPSEKTAVTIYFRNLPEKLNPMSQVQNILLELQDDPGFEVQETGPETIDGQAAVGFWATHPQKELMIWADPVTSIPIRIDIKDVLAEDVICRNFQFNSQVSQSLMEMEVPQGFVHEKHMLDLAGLPEANLIEGLRFYAKLNDGLFPEDVSVLHCIQPDKDIQDRIETLTPHDQEALQILMQTIRQFLLLQYYRGPGQWHWIGTGVELGDANTPIYWYQSVDSSTYRVIYGDLHVEDATENELPKAGN